MSLSNSHSEIKIWVVPQQFCLLYAGVGYATLMQLLILKQPFTVIDKLFVLITLTLLSMFNPSHHKGKAFIFIILKMHFEVFSHVAGLSLTTASARWSSVQRMLTQMPINLFAEASPLSILGLTAYQVNRKEQNTSF